MPKILLVNTRPTRKESEFDLDHRLKEYFDALESRGPKLGDSRTEPNNGLLTIGRCLKNVGCHVEYLDINCIEYKNFLENGHFFTFLEMYNIVKEKALDFDYIFFSSIIVGIDDALLTIDKLKAEMPDKVLVLGGTFPSLRPEYCLENCNGIDVIVIGEGENISVKVIEAFDTNNFRILEEEQGVIYRQSLNQAYVHQEGFNIIDLDFMGKLAFPDWSLLDDCLKPHIHRVMTARGCGFKCNYCVPSYMCAHHVRNYEKKLVLNAIKEIKDKFNAVNYVIGDLTFLYNQDTSRGLLEEIIKNEINIPFWCQTHLSRINEENLVLLKEAGCSQIAVGIESINSSTLKNINKGIEPGRIIEKLLLIKKFGIETQGYFMIGIPGDSKEIIELNKEFIKFGIRNGYIDRTHIGVYVPYPGPEEHETLDIKDLEYQNYTQGVFRDIPTKAVFSTERLSENTLNEVFANSLEEIGLAMKETGGIKKIYKSEVNDSGIILGSEIISLKQRIEKLNLDSSKRKVFNIVQGIRKEQKAFVSENIQESDLFIIGNMEVYSTGDIEYAIKQIDGFFDIILLDVDCKSTHSTKIINYVISNIKSSKITRYSDLHCWSRSIMQLILFREREQIYDLTILITPNNSLSDKLKDLLCSFGAKIINTPGDNKVDIIVSMEKDGAKLNESYIRSLKDNGFIVDGMIGSISERTVNTLKERGIEIFRPDMRKLILAELFLNLEYEAFFSSNVGRKKVSGLHFVAGGVIFSENDIVVDSIKTPSKILGLADGAGRLIDKKNIDEQHIDILRKAEKILSENEYGNH